MVSFWPWKGTENSPASFEKTLSALSSKITSCNSRLDNLRQHARRYKVLWTLYSIFAYLLCSIILVLVVGWKNWSAIEYTAVAGGPVVIYAVRLALTSYYDYRISKVQGHLDGLQAERDITIDKLKAATKYNTTQELLEKYGGTPSPKRKSSNQKMTPVQNRQGNPMGGRTTFVPPPTANIPGRNLSVSRPDTPQRTTPDKRGSIPQNLPSSAASLPPYSPGFDTAEFAPNAFSAPVQYATSKDTSKWYDRIMDVLMGEDETLPRNRLALICANCRLVNGQAPPGIKSLEEVGKWRCSGCGAMNGEEDEAAQIVKTIKEQAAPNLKEPSQKSQEGNRRKREVAIISQSDGQSEHPPNDSDREIADSEASIQENMSSAEEDLPEPEDDLKAQIKSSGRTKAIAKHSKSIEPTNPPEADLPTRKRGRPKGSGKAR